jgi:hypothetical protein
MVLPLLFSLYTDVLYNNGDSQYLSFRTNLPALAAVTLGTWLRNVVDVLMGWSHRGQSWRPFLGSPTVQHITAASRMRALVEWDIGDAASVIITRSAFFSSLGGLR